MAGLAREEIEDLLGRAARFWDPAGSRQASVGRLSSMSVVNLFLEPSTRTRCSFEIAEMRLGVERISLTGAEALSLVKGESLIDTARTLASMGVDTFVVRHPEVGAPARMAEAMPRVHVVNAGDGVGEHPTQALLDLLTLKRHWGVIDGRTVLIVGDIAHSRVARSNVHGLSALGAEVVLCGPERFLPAAGEHPGAALSDDLDASLTKCDAVMALRIQHERLSGDERPADLASYRDRYGLTAERVRRLPPEVVVLHPGPFHRGVEIDSDVADGPRSLIWTQVRAGVAARMAVLEALAEAGAADGYEETPRRS